MNNSASSNSLSAEQLRALNQQAISELREGRAESARNACITAIQSGANNASVWGVLALACRDMGDSEQAIQAADRSLALEPRNPRVLVVKGDAFYRRSDWRASGAFYRDALKFASPANCPVEMKAELERAQSRVAELNERFERHISSRAAPLLAASGNTSRMREAVEILCNRRQVYYPQPKHIFFPGLPLVEFGDASAFSWVAEVESAADDIREELLSVIAGDSGFAPYLTASSDRPVYDVHGMADNDSWSAFYLWENGEPVDENQAKCPKTTAAIEKVPLVFSGKRCPNVLFSRLKAGAVIPPHTGMVNTRFICHLPLVIPEGCGFRVGNDTRSWEFGKVWLFDDTIEHEAWNNSQYDRYVLIFEVWRPELSVEEQELVTTLLQAVDEY
ncbi:MAG: aspartyl/asparaginyl beta-hydroxylase domain-containing protein [Pseudomonadota bacterium]